MPRAATPSGGSATVQTEIRPRPVGPPPPRPGAPGRRRESLRVALVLAEFGALLVCLCGAIILGGPLDHGHALVHGGLILLVPAGVILLRMRQYAVTLFGLALIGVGMVSVSNLPLWRLLCLPIILWFLVDCARSLVHRPSAQGTRFARSAAAQRAWTWQGYAGAWIAVLVVCPLGIAWSLGLLHLG